MASHGIDDDIKTIFKFIQDPSLYNLVIESFQRRKSFDDVLSVVPASAESSITSQIRFRQAVYFYAHQDAHITAVAAQSRCTSLRDLALHYSTAFQNETCDTANLSALRIALLDAEATATLCGLLDTTALGDTISTVQTMVATALKDAMTAVSFDISRSSVKTIIDEFLRSLPPESDHDAAAAMLTAVQPLLAVVHDPLQLPAVYKSGYSSAHDVAAVPVDAFIKILQARGLGEDAARRIHNHALVVDVRNEQAWIAIVQAHNEHPVVPPQPKTSSPISAPGGPATDLGDGPAPSLGGGTEMINLQTLFNEMDEMEYDESLSVLSPAAYFVDLLRALKTSPSELPEPPTPIKPKPSSELAPTSPPPADPPPQPVSPNLLDELTARRPDLIHIELSPANTVVTMPYIDLVNEIMESYVKNIHSKPPRIIARNTAESATSQDCLNRPQYEEITDVYEAIISKTVFPMRVFPYNQAIDTVRSYMSALKTSRFEFLSLFQSRWRAAKLLPSISLHDSATNFERMSAVEYLGLLREDFQIITRESFEKGFVANIPDVYECWGYATEADMLNIAEDSHGLRLVKAELLVRSALTFAELLDVLRTKFLGKRLVLERADPSVPFEGDVSELRLAQPVLTESTDFNNAALTTDLCSDLQAFIRLKHKLNWSTADLDTAIIAVAGTETATINGDVICGLAYVKQLSDITSIEISKLVPLWHGLERLVESPESIQIMPPLPGQGVQPDRKTIDSSRASTAAIRALAALNLTPAEFAAIAEEFSLGKTLAVPQLSDIYRRCLLCRMLKIKPSEYSDWAAVQDFGLDPLSSPKATLQAVQQWNEACDSGLTLQHLLVMRGRRSVRNGRDEAAEQAADDAAYQLASKIIVARDLVDQTTAPSSIDAPTDEDVSKMSSLIFVPADALAVFQFVEDKTTRAGSFQHAAPPRTVPSSPEDQNPGELFYDALDAINQAVHSGRVQLHQSANTLNIQLQGIMPQSAIDNIKKLLDSNADWATLVDKLVAELQTMPKALQYHLSKETQTSLCTGKAPEAANPPKDTLEADIWRSEYMNGRRSTFIKALQPAVQNNRQQSSILDTIKSTYPGIDAPTWQYLLTEVLRVNKPVRGGFQASQATVTQQAAASSGPPDWDMMTALQTLAHPSLKDYETKAFAGFFLPPTTDNYRFGYPPGTSRPVLIINGAQITFSTNSDLLWSSEVKLTSGQKCQFSFSGQVSQLQWTTRAGCQTMQAEHLISSKAVASVKDSQRVLLKATLVVTQYRLTINTLRYLHGPSSPLDINRLGFADFKSLSRLQTLATAAVPRPETEPLVDFLNWTALSDRQGTLVDRLVSLFNWPKEHATDLLVAKYPEKGETDLVKLMGGLEELAALKGAVDYIERLGLQTVAAEKLFCLADFAAATKPEFDNAETLRTTFLSSQRSDIFDAYDGLRQRQRTALIEYLLQQHEIKDEQHINDADGLFEYFLIDVQMGSTLKTSRIKQAISTVQLFVQRCLLGLEKARIPVRAVSQKRKLWDWLLKYTLWVANRKILLYPESFVDPSLRDDKTEMFKTLETKLMQSDLSYPTICNALMQYIYSADKIADLEIQAYFWDQKSKPQRYYFFARTRTAPYSFYYCTMDYGSTHAVTVPFPYWTTWSKIDVEIVTHETDSDGSTLDKTGTYMVPALIDKRLFLFLPQFTLKAPPQYTEDKPKPPNAPKLGDTTAEALISKLAADAKASLFWELRMGWTELQNGKWAAKEVSEGLIKIEKPPKISTFNFGPYKHMDAFGVNCWTLSPKQTITDVGRFEVRGSKLASVPQDQTPIGTNVTAQTAFQRFHHIVQSVKDERPDSLDVGHEKPVVAGLDHIKGVSAGDTATYTLSYNMSDTQRLPSGMVLEIATRTDVASYIAMPPAEGTHISQSPVLVRHITSGPLMQRATSNSDIDILYSYLSLLGEEAWRDAFGYRMQSVYHELATPYALYNWEIGVHALSLIMERLLAAQQYETALRMARYVFDPTIPGENNPSSQRCWRFPPFSHIDREDSPAKRLRGLVPSRNEENPTAGFLKTWLNDPLSVHAVAREMPTIYMKRIVLVYIKILIASGDSYFRQLTLECMPMAIQCYVEASHVYGSASQKIPKLGKRRVYTFDDLAGRFNDFSNATLDLELEFPFYTRVQDRGKSPPDPKQAAQPMAFLRTGYFAYPANPEIADLRRSIDDRLFKIRNGLSIDGNPVKLPLWDQSIDPRLLLQAGPAGAGLDMSLFMQTLNAPMPNYRFTYLIGKATELCNELRSLAAEYLSAREKMDAEELAVLRASQESAVQALIMDMKQAQKAEAEKSIESMQISRGIQEMKLSFYLKLLGEKGRKVPAPDTNWEDITQSIAEPTKDDDLVMSPQEAIEMLRAEVAMEHNSSAVTYEKIAAWLQLMPTITINAQPAGLGASSNINYSAVASAIATSHRLDSGIAMDESSRAARKAQLIRQLQDRRLQANMAGREIEQIDAQIAAQRCRVDVTEKDIDVQRKQIENTAATEAWYRKKYTNQELYTWMGNSLQDLHHRAYTLGFDLAKKAEAAFKFERGMLADPNSTVFLSPAGYWDSTRNGLLAAENLSLGLRRLEAAYMEQRGYDFEITKNVSLRQLDAMALVTLRDSGSCEFSVPEVLFDMDFPGHYCRRIKSVAVTIPCIVGPYSGMSATLTLLDHSYRIDKKARDQKDYPRQNGDASPDSRFHTDRIPIQAIALSTGQQDAGVFELNFRDERYMPFEGAGAISSWRFELPTAIRQFDYNTISDVIVQIRYTAVNGGSPLKGAATKYVESFVRNSVGLGLCTVFDVKNDFSNDWRMLLQQRSPPGGGEFAMKLPELEPRLPYWVRRGSAKTRKVMLLVASDSKKSDSQDPPSAIITEVGLKVGGATADTPLPLQPGRKVGGWSVYEATHDGVAFVNWTLAFTTTTSNAVLPYTRAMLITGYCVE